MKSDMLDEIELPQGVQARIDGVLLVIKGPKGEVRRRVNDPQISVQVQDGKILLEAKKGTKREKSRMNSMSAHINNMIAGSQKPFTYLLKICSSHFPMNVSVSGKDFIVKNFLGEKVPRAIKLREGVAVKVAGDQIVVESADIELAGQTAGNIESLMRISKRDPRIFQDGIHIFEKCGVRLS